MHSYTAYLLPFLLVISLTINGCNNHESHQQVQADNRPTIPVKLIEAKTISIPDQVEIMGNLQAFQTAVISSRISGTITKIDVIPGTQVKKGDVLVEINADEINAQLLQAKAELDQAARNLEREKKLLQRKATTVETVKALEDVHKIALAGFKEAQIMFGYTTITAPFDGQITKKLADVGELVNLGSALLHLENSSQYQVSTNIPETLALHLKLGMIRTVTVPSAGLTTEGIISEIAPIADPTTHTVPIKLDISSQKNLRSGQFARITIPGQEVNTIIIPEESVIVKGQLECVFVVVDNRARLRLVRTGQTYPEGKEILTGLNEGDMIITEGADKVADGQQVTT